jgi:hypothetical protein
MSNPPKQKGTAGETELVRMLQAEGVPAWRNPPSAIFDVSVPGDYDGMRVIEVLATRPDRGQWLVTLTFKDFMFLYDRDVRYPLAVEVKRYARFAHHKIYEAKFGRKRAAS